MAITIDEVTRHLEALRLKFRKRDDENVVLFMKMEHYRDRDGDDGLMLVIRLEEEGEYFKLYAPQAFTAEGPHVDAFLKACTIVQWQTKLVQFEYDPSDGEIRPIIEFPIEDGTITEKQLARCLFGMCRIMDEFYEPLHRALTEGVIEFPKRYEAMGRMFGELMQRLLAGLSPEERAAVLQQVAQQSGTAPSGDSGPGTGGGTPPTEV